MLRRLEALGLGIRRSALGPVFALSGLTVRESVRKKVFIVLAVFTLVMLGATAMLPAIRAEDRVPLVETWAQRGITFFGVLLVVFLAGVSIPEDIEERKIFTLLSKPLARWQLLAGRFAGFACLLAAFALATGLISAVFLRVVSRGSGATLANTTEYLASEVRIEEEKSQATILARRTPDKPFEATISGSPDGVAVYRFARLPLHDLPEQVPLRLSFDIQAEALLMFGIVEIFIRPAARDISPEPARKLGWEVGWSEKPREGQPPPPIMAKRTFTAKVGVTSEFLFPRSWIDRSGAIDFAVKRAQPGIGLTVRHGSLAVVSEPHNFEWNFAKGLASTFLLWTVVLALTLMGSTVLSAPVNLLFGIAVFVAGSMIGFLRESLPAVEHQLVQAEQEEAAADDGHHHAKDPIPTPVLRVSQAISNAVIGVVPDLAEFDVSVPILQGRDVPVETVGRGLRTALLYAAGALLLGLAFFRMREFR
ncbi:MAG: ABC transporter permease [Planctomycetes bacterium]|nr:ABC transporter permease [Planctomycetota bacterium]